MFQKIWQKIGEPQEKKAFDSVLRTINTICMDKNGDARREALLDFQKILLRPVQNLTVRSCYLFEDSAESVPFDFNTTFGLSQTILEENGAKLCTPSDSLSLQTCADLLFFLPHPSLNLLKMLGEIGKDNRPLGSFQQTEKQSILWIEPLNIGFAVGETLPICISELNENASLRPQEVLDIQSCLEKIRFNGAHWIDENNDILGKPVFPEFGWIWEIHRKSLFEFQ